MFHVRLNIDPENPKRVEHYEGLFDFHGPCYYNKRSKGCVYRVYSRYTYKKWVGKYVRIRFVSYVVLTQDLYVLAVTPNKRQSRFALWSLSMNLLPGVMESVQYVASEISFVDFLGDYCRLSPYVSHGRELAVAWSTFRRVSRELDTPLLEILKSDASKGLKLLAEKP